jgi:hypothetical protein
MKYDHVPRPLTEDHYYIRELIEGQEKRTADRNFHRERQKTREERDNLIKDSKMVVVTDFYCNTCRKDFKSIAIKQVEIDWSNSTQDVAFYKTKCDKGHWCLRHITDKDRDGFYIRSKLSRLDQGHHYADILQPFQTGYELLYSNKNK